MSGSTFRSSAGRSALGAGCFAAVLLLAVNPAASDQYQYDVMGRLTQVQYSSGGITAYTYDAKGNILSIVSSLATAVEETEAEERFAFALGQNTPNPGTGLMSVPFSIPSRGRVVLRVYDVSGRLVMTPLDATLNPGRYAARITASGLPGGVYFYRLEAGNQRLSKKLVVIP